MPINSITSSTKTQQVKPKKFMWSKQLQYMQTFLNLTLFKGFSTEYQEMPNVKYKELYNNFINRLAILVDAKQNNNYLPLSAVSENKDITKLQNIYENLKDLIQDIIKTAINNSTTSEKVKILHDIKKIIEKDLKEHPEEYVNLDLTYLNDSELRRLSKQDILDKLLDLKYNYRLILEIHNLDLPNKFFKDLVVHIHNLAIYTASQICQIDVDARNSLPKIRDEIFNILSKFDKIVPSNSGLSSKSYFHYNSNHNENDKIYLNAVSSRMIEIMNSKKVNTKDKEYVDTSISFLVDKYLEIINNPIKKYDILEGIENFKSFSDKMHSELLSKHKEILEKEDAFPDIKNLTEISAYNENTISSTAKKAHTWSV